MASAASTTGIPTESQDNVELPHMDTPQLSDESNNVVVSETEGMKWATALDLPPELISLIIEFILFPESLLDPSLDSGFSVAWVINQRKKLSLLKVNKIWYQASIGFLYRHIVIRHHGQLPLLLRTLEETQLDENKYASLIQNVDISCYVPEDLECLFIRDIEWVYALCPHAVYAWQPPVFSKSLLKGRLYGILSSIAIFSSIAFKQEGPRDLDVVARLASLSAMTLTSLNLLFDDALGDTVVNPNHTPLVLPNLEVLQLGLFFTKHSFVVDHLSDFMAQMQLPKLHHARLPAHSPLTKFSWGGPIVEHFLKRHGPQLKTLQLYRVFFYTHYQPITAELWMFIQHQVDFCPNLQHLVVGPDFPVPEGLAFHHISLQFLDIWGAMELGTDESLTVPQPLPFNWGDHRWEYPRKDVTISSPSESHISSSSESRISSSSESHISEDPRPTSLDILSPELCTLPSLRNVRRIDPVLRYLPDLPFLLHPSAYATVDEPGFLISLPGGPIQVSPCLIYHIEDDSLYTNYESFVANGSFLSIVESSSESEGESDDDARSWLDGWREYVTDESSEGDLSWSESQDEGEVSSEELSEDEYEVEDEDETF